MTTATAPPCDTAALKAHFERPERVTWWGQEYERTPAVVSKVFGDGLQLIALSPVMHRPNYYVVRVDSGWSIDNWSEGELLIDHLDEIYESIEGEYGLMYAAEDEEREGEDRQPFPAADFDGGSGWGELAWPAPEKTP